VLLVTDPLEQLVGELRVELVTGQHPSPVVASIAEVYSQWFEAHGQSSHQRKATHLIGFGLVRGTPLVLHASTLRQRRAANERQNSRCA